MVDRRVFKPSQWLNNLNVKKQATPVSRQKLKCTIQQEVEIVLRRIEAYNLDLTMNYEDWLKLGFALANEFGEMGRGYFHRASRFHISYNHQDCDRQFDKCLKGQKGGIRINSFFWMAKEAGVDIKIRDYS